MSKANPKRPITGPKAFGTVMGLSLLAGGLAGLGTSFAGDLEGPAGFAVTLAITGVAMAVALVLCIWWWGRIDEAAREAHKWAWWWGGCTGMAVGGAILLALLNREGEVDLGGMPVDQALASGMFLMLICQVIGYTVAWLVWWAKRR
ncbi:MAG: hypothetical protein EON87_01655 [Brevundimonas sp.]|nr:MAG: hypothetical protein EON87_01655 [Brevundimonas sp.]